MHRSSAALAILRSPWDTASVAPRPEVTVRLRELETALTQLPTDELTAFARWFEDHLADAWDRHQGRGLDGGEIRLTLTYGS